MRPCDSTRYPSRPETDAATWQVYYPTLVRMSELRSVSIYGGSAHFFHAAAAVHGGSVTVCGDGAAIHGGLTAIYSDNCAIYGGFADINGVAALSGCDWSPTAWTKRFCAPSLFSQPHTHGVL
eukprot:1579711-Rhodomonas_salina.1